MRSPFSTALRAAITTSGHSLEDLASRLRELGTPAGVSTLSSWQSGVNHPERRSSLAALAGLEELLGLAPRSLLGLLPQRRPRGRWRPPSATNLSHQRMWRSPKAVERVLAKLDAVPEDLYIPSRVSRAVKIYLDAEGQEHKSHHRLLVRGETERADRMIEFSIRYPPGQTERHYDLRVPPGLRDLVLEIHFDPARVPVRCHGFYQPAQERPERVLNCSRRRLPWFQSVVLDPQPGIYGVRWDWS